MADIQQNNIADTAAASAREAKTTSIRDTDKAVAGEQRSFENGVEATRRVGELGTGVARDLAQTAADTTRRLGEAGRETGREAVDAWRQAIAPLASIQMDMSRWVEDLWRQTTGFSPLASLHSARPFGGLGAAALFGLPATDVRETEQAYVLAVELPGLAREDVDLTVTQDSLTLRGHKAENRTHGAGAYRVSERRFGHFERSFPIPPDVERNRLEASFKDGLLTITLPKTEQAARDERKIEIHG